MYFDPDIYEDNKIVDEELARFNVNNTVVDNLDCEITLAEITKRGKSVRADSLIPKLFV